MVCAQCDTNNPGGSAHCYRCGHDLSKPAARSRPDARRPRVPASTPPPAAPSLLATVDIAGTPLTVTGQEITFGSIRLQCQDVKGIRYGVFKQYTNGIRTSQSYAIWLTDNTTFMNIECAKGWFVSDATIEGRYADAVNALYAAVMIPIMNRFLGWLERDNGFIVGGVTFSRACIYRDRPLSTVDKGFYKLLNVLGNRKTVEERERDLQVLRWGDLGGHTFDAGSIRLHRGKEVWADFSLRDVWNAVCLGPLLDFLFEEGRVWNIVAR